MKRLQQTKSTVKVINNPSLPKRNRKTPIRFDPAPQIEQLPEIQDEFTKVRRQIAQRIIEIDEQDDEQNELEDNSDNVQNIELLLENEEEENQQINSEMIANKQQRTEIHPNLFSVYQKQMTEFLQQSKQREKENKRQLELIQTRLEETEQKLAIEQFRRNQIEQPTHRINSTNSIVFDPAPPKFTTPSFSGILEEDKIDYDTWVQCSRRYLSCWNVPDSHKITATLMNIKSPAIEIN